jgi:hypothetical protein
VTAMGRLATIRRTPPPGLACGEPDDRLQRGIQYAAASRFYFDCSRILDRPLSRAMTAKQASNALDYAAGTGSAVIDLIFSIAKREVTFFSGTALISFL